MQLALNGATTLLSPLTADLAAASSAGYAGLEIWLQKLNSYLEQGTLSDLRARLQASGLRPLTINSLERFNLNDPSGRVRTRVEAERLCRLAAALGVEAVVVVPGPLPAGLDREEGLRRTVDDLRDLLPLADSYNVRLALEFLGFADCSVRSLAEALAVTRTVHSARLGVVVDTFHFYIGGSDLADLRRLRPGELQVLHINDCEPGPLAEMTDDRRLYPGLGEIPLTEYIAAIPAGVCQWVSVEIFRPEYWHRPASEVAAAALRHARHVLGAAGA